MEHYKEYERKKDLENGKSWLKKLRLKKRH